VIDRLLGGKGRRWLIRGLHRNRAEDSRELLKVVIDDLREAWKPMVDLDAGGGARNATTTLADLWRPLKSCWRSFSCPGRRRARDDEPVHSGLILEPIIQKFISVYSRSREVPPSQRRSLLDVLSSVPFPVAAELHGPTASMEDLMTLAPGDGAAPGPIQWIGPSNLVLCGVFMESWRLIRSHRGPRHCSAPTMINTKGDKQRVHSVVS